MYPYALFSMYLYLTLSTIKSQKKERKYRFNIHFTALSFRVVWHCISDETLAHADSNSKAKLLPLRELILS